MRETEFSCIRLNFTDGPRVFLKCFNHFMVPWANQPWIKSRHVLREQKSKLETCKKSNSEAEPFNSLRINSWACRRSLQSEVSWIITRIFSMGRREMPFPLEEMIVMEMCEPVSEGSCWSALIKTTVRGGGREMEPRLSHSQSAAFLRAERASPPFFPCPGPPPPTADPALEN